MLKCLPTGGTATYTRCRRVCVEGEECVPYWDASDHWGHGRNVVEPTLIDIPAADLRPGDIIIDVSQICFGQIEVPAFIAVNGASTVDGVTTVFTTAWQTMTLQEDPDSSPFIMMYPDAIEFHRSKGKVRILRNLIDVGISNRIQVKREPSEIGLS